jgi:hypothetical protein
MFYFRPGPCFSLTRLFEALAQSLRLSRSEHIVGVDDTPGLHQHALAVFGECHEIPLVHAKVVENLARNDHLAALPDPPDGFA